MDNMVWNDDATWILTSSFIIFTMQSGFGLLEAGAVTLKNEVNIMVKNAVDVIFGGLSYWLFGYGVSFGKGNDSNAFTGIGLFAVDVPQGSPSEGKIFSHFVFQLSFATTATTIVSGAMAERTKLSAYIIFSFFNTVGYCFPAHWMWAEGGFLRSLGCIDIAGSGVVHLTGGTSALVAALLLGPRTTILNSMTSKSTPVLGNPANAMIGMFMLWWGWLGFNCGSTFGISGDKWIVASRSAINTLNASMAGGAVGLLTSYITKCRKYDITYLINALLGSLVSITASCAAVRPWESLIIGSSGAVFVLISMCVMPRLEVDDPVGAISVHGMGGLWGLIATGLFFDQDKLISGENYELKGVFHGGGYTLLGVQLLAGLCFIVWSGLVTFIILLALKLTIGIRLSPEEEALGADYIEHGICEYKDIQRTSAKKQDGPLTSLGGQKFTENCATIIRGCCLARLRRISPLRLAPGKQATKNKRAHSLPAPAYVNGATQKGTMTT